MQVKDIGKSTFSAKVSCPLSSARTQVQAAWAVRQEWEDCSTCWLKRQVRTRFALFRTHGPLPSSHWPTPPPTPPTSLRQPARHRQTATSRLASQQQLALSGEVRRTSLKILCIRRWGLGMHCFSPRLLLGSRRWYTYLAADCHVTGAPVSRKVYGHADGRSLTRKSRETNFTAKRVSLDQKHSGGCMTQINVRLLSWTIMKR